MKASSPTGPDLQNVSEEHGTSVSASHSEEETKFKQPVISVGLQQKYSA